MTAGCNLALAFAGSLCSAAALALALVAGEPVAASCALATTTYCLAEFIVRAEPLPGGD